MPSVKNSDFSAQTDVLSQSRLFQREITSFLPLFQFQDIVLDITSSVSNGKLQTSLGLDRSSRAVWSLRGGVGGLCLGVPLGARWGWWQQLGSATWTW